MTAGPGPRAPVPCVERFTFLRRVLESGLSLVADAATQGFVATRPRLARISGSYVADCDQAKMIQAARDDALAEQRWRWTEELVG